MGTFSVSIGRLGVLLLLTTVVAVPPAEAQRAGSKDAEEIGFQTWKDPSGKFKIDARLVEQSESQIILEDKTKRHRTVEKKRIDSAQINPVHLAWLRKQDTAQYALVRSLVGNSTSTSQGLVLGDPEPYLAAHRRYPSAPYAGIVAAIALSMEKNDFEAAIRTLRDVVNRCENHRAFDENAHPLTLAAALNNLAICLLKDGKGNAGVSSLQQAAKHLKSIPRELVHNAKIVQKIGTENTILSITKKQLSDMSLAIANASAAESDTHEHPYFQYGLFWDVPRHTFASEITPWTPSQAPNDRGQFPGQPYQGPKRYISFVSGYGFGVASNWVVTNAHFFRGPFWEPGDIAVRLQSLAGGQSITVNTADLQFAPEESGLDLVLIKVSEPISKPIPLTASDPSVGAELTVFDCNCSQLRSYEPTNPQ